MTTLARANLVVFALLATHTIDHAANQPARDLPVTGTFVGVAGFAIITASAVLALRRSGLAPVAALAAGATTALGVIAVHILPVWSEAISDPYWDFGANALSWALLLAPLVASLWLAIAGARELRAPAVVSV